MIFRLYSTMSAGLNTAAGTLYEDFIDNFMPKRRSDWAASLVIKITVLIIGIICVGFVYLVERLSTILQVAYSLVASPNAAIFLAFTLGLFFPWANSKVGFWMQVSIFFLVLIIN